MNVILTKPNTGGLKALIEGAHESYLGVCIGSDKTPAITVYTDDEPQGGIQADIPANVQVIVQHVNNGLHALSNFASTAEEHTLVILKLRHIEDAVVESFSSICGMMGVDLAIHIQAPAIFEQDLRVVKEKAQVDALMLDRIPLPKGTKVIPPAQGGLYRDRNSQPLEVDHHVNTLDHRNLPYRLYRLSSELDTKNVYTRSELVVVNYDK